MSIRVQFEESGPFAICDTPAEAVELLKQARSVTASGQSSPATKPSTAPASKPRGNEHGIDHLLATVNDNVRNLLKKATDYPDGVEGDEFSQACGVGGSGLGGILSSLSKACKKAHVNMGQLLQSEARFEGTRRYRWIAPTKLLMSYRDKL